MHGMHMEEATAPNRLRELRESRNLRLLDVAKVADRDPSVIRRYEDGSVAMPLDVIERLAAFHGVTRAYLMGWDEDEPKAVA